MTSEFNDILKQGYIKLKGKKVGVWKKQWAVLRRPSSKGPFRLEKYSDEKTALLKYQNRHEKFIDLSSAGFERMPGDSKKHAISICIPDQTPRVFALDSDYEANQWLIALNDEAEKIPLSGAPESPIVFPLKDRFNVYLLPSNFSSFFGECVLQVTASDLVLFDALDPTKHILAWPLTSLRRYAKDSTKFIIESGRLCETGEGLFIFNTRESEKINQLVKQATLAIFEAHGIQRRHLRKQSSNSSTEPDSAPSTLPRKPITSRTLSSSSSSSSRGPLPEIPQTENQMYSSTLPTNLPSRHSPPPANTPSCNDFDRPVTEILDSELSRANGTEADNSDDDSEASTDDYTMALINQQKDLEPKFRKFIQSRAVDPQA